MDKVDKLKDIWDNIPKVVTEQIDLSQKELINRYIDIFHFGEYFYVIFNTRTAEMEYVSPNIEKILGYMPNDFYLQVVMDNIHQEDLPYYYHYEQSAVRFFFHTWQKTCFLNINLLMTIGLKQRMALIKGYSNKLFQFTIFSKVAQEP